MDLLQPTFGETESFKTLREFLDTAVTGFQYLHKILSKYFNNFDETDNVENNTGLETTARLKKISLVLSNIAEAMSELGTSEAPVDVFNM